MPINIQAIQEEQVAYFNGPSGKKNPDGSDIIRGQFKQTSGAGYRVDVYDGPNGPGYVVIELSGEQEKSTDYGTEEWRSHDWEDIAPPPLSGASSEQFVNNSYGQ